MKATSGAQVNETERAFLLSTFPNYAELVQDGELSDTAQNKLDTWYEKGRSFYLSHVPESQKDKANANWATKFGQGRVSEGAPAGGGPSEDAIAAKMREIEGR